MNQILIKEVYFSFKIKNNNNKYSKINCFLDNLYSKNNRLNKFNNSKIKFRGSRKNNNYKKMMTKWKIKCFKKID